MKTDSEPVAKKKKKKKDEIGAKFIWFGNDADGLSMIDLLAVGMFLFFLILKVTQLVLSIIFIENSELVQQINLIMADINQNMYVIITSYFIKKSVDTTVTKVGLFRAGEYEKVLIQPQEHNNKSSEDTEDENMNDFQLPDDLENF